MVIPIFSDLSPPSPSPLNWQMNYIVIVVRTARFLRIIDTSEAEMNTPMYIYNAFFI